MTTALCFNGVKFDTINRENQIWIRVPQIGGALGYTHPEKAVSNIYSAHADEFTPSMTQVVKIGTNGGAQETRIFSLRGCHLLAMFARTDVAKEFRRWVLDILDKIAATEAEKKVKPKTPKLPATPKKKYSVGLYGYLEEFEDIVCAVHDKLTERGATLFLALDQHSHKVPLSLNEELLLQSVHDYTSQAIIGSKLLLGGIEGCRRIRRVHSFKNYE